MTRAGSSSCSSLRRICACCAASRSGVNAASAASTPSVADVVEPAAELHGALGADVAPIEVRGPVAGHDRLDERLLGKMSLTKHCINEPHDCTLLLAAGRRRRSREQRPAGAGWPGTNARARSIRSGPSSR